MGRGGAASAISRGAALAIFVARLCPTSIRSGAFVYNLCRRHAAGDSIDQRGTPMKQYPLSIYQPDGDPPPPQVLKPIMQDIDTLVQEIKAAGAWVFNGGLRVPSTATVVRVRDGEALVTDGPCTEGKEHVAGCLIIKAPDLDAALEWSRKATRAITLPNRGAAVPGRGGPTPRSR
jgi:hypothetical protein